MKIDDPRLEEATQFVIVNKTAKGVRSDLAEDYLRKIQQLDPSVLMNLPARVTSGIEWKPKAIDIAEMLNDTSPAWKGKIQFPNEPKASTSVTQVSFTDSLKPILQSDSFQQFSKEDLAKILAMYWDAIYELCSEAIDNPDDHVIQKTVGVYVLHKLVPDILAYAASPGEKLTKSKIVSVLDGLDAMESKFWHSNGAAGLVGTSGKAFAILANQIRTQLQESRKKPGTTMKPFEI
jgi:hypothetical protein